MKQKIVIKVPCMTCCGKCPSRAMAVAATTSGVVDSVEVAGEHRDDLVVVGDCVDAAKLTAALRKKIGGNVRLLYVGEVKKEKKADDKKPPPAPPAPAVVPPPPPPPPPPTFTTTIVCHHYHHYGYPNPCPLCGRFW